MESRAQSLVPEQFGPLKGSESFLAEPLLPSPSLRH